MRYLSVKFIQRLVTIVLGTVICINLYSYEPNNELDYFGLPKVDITFLNPKDVDFPCMDAKIYPWSWVDGRFFLIEKDITPMCISLANPKEIKNSNPRFIIDLPDGIDVIGGIYGMPLPEIILSEKGRKTWSVPIPSYYCTLHKKHQAGGSMRIALLSSLPGTDKLLEAVYYYKDDTIRQPEQHIKLGILPPISQIKKPATFKTGVLLGSQDMCFKGKPLELWVELLKKSGIDYLCMPESMAVTEPGADRYSGDYYKELNKRGIKVFIEPFRLGGYVFDMGYWLCRPVPKEGEFIRLDGSVAPNMASMYWVSHSQEFRNKLYDYLFDLSVTNKRCDSFAMNWEPWPASMMDYSDETLKDMAVFLGQNPEDVKTLGRMNFIKKNKAKLIDFRNKQLGDVMKVIYEVLKELEPKAGHELDMMPLVNADLTKEYNNYPGDIGKYSRIISPFAYPGMHFILKDYKGIVNRFSDGFPDFVSWIRLHKQWAVEQNPQAPPKLYHCGDFNGATDSICPPEQMRLQAILDMVYGYDAIGYYRFFMGYDGRYYHAIAKICGEISKLEPYLCNKKLNQEKGIIAEGYPGKSVPNLDEGKWRPDFINATLANDGTRRVLSLANMQERWEALVFLKLTEMPEGFYSIYEPLTEKQISINGKTDISAKDLKEGLFLKLLPNDIKVWAIEKWNGKNKFEKTINLSSAKEEFEVAKKEWLIKAEEEKMNKKVEPSTAYKLSFAPLQNSKFKTYAQNSNIMVECYGQKFIIDVMNGAKISSWTFDGAEMVRGGVFLRDRLWEEKKDIWKKGFANSSYKIDDAVLSEKELSIKFSCDYPHLPVKLNKTFTFTSDYSIKVLTTLKNAGAEIITIGYWVENWPYLMDREKSNNGKWYLHGMKGVFSSEAFFLSSFYQFDGIPHTDMLALTPYKLQMQKEIIKGEQSVIYSSSIKKGYVIKAPFNKMGFYYSWDSLDSSFKTVDMIFRHVSLSPGEDWNVEFSINKITGEKEFNDIIKAWK